MLTEEKDDSNQRISEKAQFSFGGQMKKSKYLLVHRCVTRAVSHGRVAEKS